MKNPGFLQLHKTIKMKILFVCFGNICRSPAAEAIMNTFLEKEGLTKQVTCDSAGTSEHHAGHPADPRMIQEAKTKGHNIESLSRTFEKEDFNRFDWIITMDDHNYENVLSLAQNTEQEKKVLKMASFCKRKTCDFIPDPYYGETESFKNIISLLEDGCSHLLEKLKKTLLK